MLKIDGEGAATASTDGRGSCNVRSTRKCVYCMLRVVPALIDSAKKAGCHVRMPVRRLVLTIYDRRTNNDSVSEKTCTRRITFSFF